VRIFKLMLVAVLAAWALPAVAEPALDLLDAPVPYSARFTVSSDKGVYQGQVWHAPGRERRDFETAGGGQALLLLRGDDAAYLMKPSSRWYIGFNMHAAATLAGGLDALEVERKKVKDETVGGIRATRYKVTAAGGRFDGDAWFTKDGIMVKAVGTLQGSGRVETQLSDLHVGSVDEAKLGLPNGWLGIDLKSVAADKLVQVIGEMAPTLGKK
jgi:hypothetical protein